MKLTRLRALNWRTATWEFTVIVAGILVALAVDRWNEGRADRALERSYQTRLASDLHSDSIEFSAVTSRIESSYGAATFLLETLYVMPAARPDAPPQRSKDWSLAEALDMAGRVSLFVPASGTYDELVATGNLRVLRSDSVRTALAAYYLAAQRERLYDPILKQSIWIRYNGTLRDAGITPHSGYRSPEELRRATNLATALEGVREALAQQHAFLHRVDSLRIVASMSLQPRPAHIP